MALKKIGVMWKDEKTGNLTGELDLGVHGEVRIGVYPNKKQNEKQPDFSIVLFQNDKR